MVKIMNMVSMVVRAMKRWSKSFCAASLVRMSIDVMLPRIPNRPIKIYKYQIEQRECETIFIILLKVKDEIDE